MNDRTALPSPSLPALAALLLAALALALAACGGDDETTGEAAAGDEPPAATTTAEGESGDAGKGDKGDDGGKSGDDSGSGERGSGGVDEDGITKDGRDRSIQTFGEPADKETSDAMVEAVTGYFGALADKDTSKACTFLAGSVSDQMEQLIEQARQQGQAELPEGKSACEIFLQTAATAFSGKAAPKFEKMKFRRFRVDGDRGFVLYKIPNRPASFMPAAQEDGVWKVAAIDGSALP